LSAIIQSDPIVAELRPCGRHHALRGADPEAGSRTKDEAAFVGPKAEAEVSEF
jgi:hypothetical protein